MPELRNQPIQTQPAVIPDANIVSGFMDGARLARENQPRQTGFLGGLSDFLNDLATDPVSQLSLALIQAGGAQPTSVGLGERLTGAFLGAGQRLEQARNAQIERDFRAAQIASQLRPETGPLIQIPDPESPTGFTFATRQQAVGQPAPTPEGRRPRQREQRIQELVGRGVSQNQAADLVDGFVEFEIDPLTGRARGTINRATGQFTPFDGDTGLLQQPGAPAVPTPVAQADPLDPTPADVQRITGGIDIVGEATGPLDTAAAVAAGVPIVSDILREFGVDGQDERQARVAFQTLGQDLRRAFANNPRVPVAEQNRLGALLPRTGFFSTESAALADLTALDRELTTRLASERRVANDPTVAVQVRRAAQSTAEALPSIIQRIRAFRVAAGSVVGDISNATVDDLIPLVRSDNLSAADRERVRSRLRELERGDTN
jgi:hypothetical protein